MEAQAVGTPEYNLAKTSFDAETAKLEHYNERLAYYKENVKRAANQLIRTPTNHEFDKKLVEARKEETYFQQNLNWY